MYLIFSSFPLLSAKFNESLVFTNPYYSNILLFTMFLKRYRYTVCCLITINRTENSLSRFQVLIWNKTRVVIYERK